MTITDLQSQVIQTLKDSGYKNVRDSLLSGISYGEDYPIVVVDILYSENMQLASGDYYPVAVGLSIFVYQKLGTSVKNTRLVVADEIENILSVLDFEIVDNKIKYVDTVLNSIKVCSAGCAIVCDIDKDVRYRPTLVVDSDISNAKIYLDDVYTGFDTPAFIKKASSGTYSLVKDDYIFDNIVVDLSDNIDKSIYFQSKHGKLNSPAISFNVDDGKCYITTDEDVDAIVYEIDGVQYIYDKPFYIDSCTISAKCVKHSYVDSDITVQSFVVPFARIKNATNGTYTRIRLGVDANTIFTCTEGILICATESGTYTNSITVTSGNTRYIYILIVDGSIDSYIYCIDKTVNRLGASPSTLSIANNVYALSTDSTSLRVGDIYIYLSRCSDSFLYINAYTSIYRFIYIIGELKSATTTLLFYHNVVIDFTNGIHNSLQRIDFNYCSFIICGNKCTLPDSIKRLVILHSNFPEIYGEFPIGFNYLYIVQSNFAIISDVSNISGLTYFINVSGGYTNLIGNLSFASNCSMIYISGSLVEFESNSPLPASCTYVSVDSPKANWITNNFSIGTVTISIFLLTSWRVEKFDKVEMVAILTSMKNRVGKFPSTCRIGQYINYNNPEAEVVDAISALRAAHTEITTVSLVV